MTILIKNRLHYEFFTFAMVALNQDNTLRVFFALALPDAVKRIIFDRIIGKLKNEEHFASLLWTEPNNLHLTLQFIGQLKASDLPALVAHIQRELKGYGGSYLTLGPLELFPSPEAFKLLTLKVGPAAYLGELAARIGQGMHLLGYTPDPRPYRGHVTLGRYPSNRRPPPPPALKAFYLETPLLTEVALYRSDPSPQGSCYTLLSTLPLA